MAASFAALQLVGGSASAGGNPWNLRCASMLAEQHGTSSAPHRSAALLPLDTPGGQGTSLRPHLPRRPVEQDRDLTRRRLNRQLGLLPSPSADRGRTELPGTSDRHGPPARQEQASRRTRLFDQRSHGLHRQPTGRLVRISPSPLRSNSHHQPARRLADRADRTADRTYRLLRDQRLRWGVARCRTARGAWPGLRHHRLVTGRSRRFSSGCIADCWRRRQWSALLCG